MFRSYSPVLFCALIVCSACAPAPAQIGASTSTALVEGSVVNKITGAPVRHAHVIYNKVPGQGSSSLSVDTDADGRFSIPLEAGSYRLRIERPGFASQAYGARTAEGNGTVLTLAPGQQVRDIRLRMTPLGAIAGRVLDEDGEPIQGAGIQVLRFSFATGRRQLIPVAGAGSNDRGEYRAYNLPAGRYFLLTTLRGAPMSRPPETDAILPEIQQSFAPVYYPGVLDFTSASPISLPEGGEISDADIHAQKTHGVMLRGRILSPIQNSPGSRLQVVLAHNDNNLASSFSPSSAIVDENAGRFEFHGIAPGSYFLIASQLHDGVALSGRVQVDLTADATPPTVNVTLTQGSDITGNVRIEGGPAGATPPMTIQLSPGEGLTPSRHPSAKVAPDGGFRLSGVTPGVWDFTLTPLPDDLWIKSATLGGIDVLKGELNFFQSGKEPLHIVLSGGGAQISGVVKQGDQPVRAVVVLAPAASEWQGLAQMYRSTAVQENGTFLFRGVRPGAYKLFAFQEVEPFAWLDPDFLKPIESLGEPISVSDGEKVSRQLTPIPPDALLPSR